MKTSAAPLILLCLFLSSCTTMHYYQILRTSVDKGTIQEKKIVVEDTNCKITYDLWDEDGNIGFVMKNKTAQDLTLDLSKTFFVLNGYANVYFKNRVFSES
ncbi:MAG: hypothetical protein M3Q95_03155 [Bacteroidota bacterium]|nr:hypothetical protein [Bacteroidota bacterium]